MQPGRLRAHRRRVAARSARLAEETYAGAGQRGRDAARRDPAAARRRRASARPSCAAGCRSTSSTRTATNRPRACSRCSPSSRLVTVDEGTLEVAHEALLREWPRLRGWLEEDAEGRRLHQHVSPRGARLGGRRSAIPASSIAARGWPRRSTGSRPRGRRERARARVPRSRAAPKRARRRAPATDEPAAARAADRRRWRRCSPPSWPACVGARSARGGARRRADRRRPAPGRRGAHPRAPRPRAPAARARRVALDDSTATRGNLLSVLLRSPAALGVVRTTAGRCRAAAVSPDGTADGHRRRARRRLRVRRRHPAPARRAATAQGRLLLQPSLLARRQDARGRVHGPDEPRATTRWSTSIDPRTGERRRRVELPPLPEAAPSVLSRRRVRATAGDLARPPEYTGEGPDGPASPAVPRRRGGPGSRDGPAARRTTSIVLRHASETADRRRVFVTSARDDRT